jgi:hypothetical protein
MAIAAVEAMFWVYCKIQHMTFVSQVYALTLAQRLVHCLTLDTLSSSENDVGPCKCRRAREEGMKMRLDNLLNECARPDRRTALTSLRN